MQLYKMKYAAINTDASITINRVLSHLCPYGIFSSYSNEGSKVQSSKDYWFADKHALILWSVLILFLNATVRNTIPACSGVIIMIVIVFIYALNYVEY